MLLTITSTTPPATDLGHLLHKHPGRVQSFPLAFGQAHVFYPEARQERCTAALLLDVDPVGLVRGRRAGGPAAPGQFGLEQYVNDRPYAASSFLSVAIAEVYRSALAGQSGDVDAETPLDLAARVSALPCRGGAGLLRRLFEPLGYAVETKGFPLDELFPEWGESPYFAVEIRGRVRLKDLLTHLYVLIPVLDDQKHYWVGDDEVEKLLRRGAGWLSTHPERELIATRYLKHRRGLVADALERLLGEERASEDSASGDGAIEEVEEGRGVEKASAIESTVEARISLNEQRLGAVLACLRQSGARRVLDLGCGEGKLLQVLLADRQFEEVVGVDASHRALERASERLILDRLSDRQRARVKLLHGALTYRDARLAGYDAAAVVEVVEHLDPDRLAAFERVVFEHARPATVVLTTPNVEHNARFEGFAAGKLRHRDHRFEWSRAEFRVWAERVAARFGYSTRFVPVGPDDSEVGPPTQMVLFARE
jgi:3' terminal RNA ribose 2'-O-methyltransferase Hen1